MSGAKVIRAVLLKNPRVSKIPLCGKKIIWGRGGGQRRFVNLGVGGLKFLKIRTGGVNFRDF